MLIISHNSMFIAQSGPISISLVALSAQAAALLAMSLPFSQVSCPRNFLKTNRPTNSIKNSVQNIKVNQNIPKTIPIRKPHQYDYHTLSSFTK